MVLIRITKIYKDVLSNLLIEYAVLLGGFNRECDVKNYLKRYKKAHWHLRKIHHRYQVPNGSEVLPAIFDQGVLGETSRKIVDHVNPVVWGVLLNKLNTRGK